LSIGDASYAQEDVNASAAATNVTPDERLSGVIGVGQAELKGEIAQRTYRIESARAAPNDSKAGVVADRLDRIQQRLTSISTSIHHPRSTGSRIRVSG
jgi:hypothetical protein